MGALKKEKFTHKTYIQKIGRWELISGVFYNMAPAPYPKHQKMVLFIWRELDKNIVCQNDKKCQILVSPIDWKIRENTVVQPDVVIFCEETEKQYFSKTPLLIVEVLSKSTAKKDLTTKYNLYEKEGVKFYIIVYPAEEVAEIFELKDNKYESLGKFIHGDSREFTFEECKTKIDFSNVFEEIIDNED